VPGCYLLEICGRSEPMSAKEHSNKLCRFEIRVRKTIEKHSMLNPGDHVLVAVSGGADSVALLLCLHTLARALPLSLTIAHLNHRIRGQEGDDDEDFVRSLSASLHLPFCSEVIELKKQAIAGKHNLEELARLKRYEFLRRTARRIGAQKIAVGHNLNDQAETVLFRFIRGSGVEGLSAIHPVVDGLVIRPLLDCPRIEIVEYLKQKGASYRDDSTNKDVQLARNRIRMELVPYLENLNPRLMEALARQAFQSRETWAFIEAEAKQALGRLCRRDDTGISIALHGLATLHPALQKQVLRQALKECLGSLRGVTARLVDGILFLCGAGHSGGQIRISRQNIAVRQFDTLLLTKNAVEQAPSFAYKLEIPGECRVAEAGVIFRSKICNTPDLNMIRGKSATQAFLDPRTLPEFLAIRSKEPGDRYGGPSHRKVKKMLIDRKVPLLDRSDLPMVAAGKDVIWIPGFRPARTYAVRPESPSCILVEIVRDAPVSET
jgi:tRNA(Ile)-lysidine synthase